MVAQVIVNGQNIIDIDRELTDDELFGKPITKSQIAIIRLVAEGMRDKDIAEALTLSPRTITTQLSFIYRRLGIHNRTSLMLWASRNGLA